MDDEKFKKLALKAVLESLYDVVATQRGKELESELAKMGVKANVVFSLNIEDVDVDKFFSFDTNEEKRFGDLIIKPNKEEK